MNDWVSANAPEMIDTFDDQGRHLGPMERAEAHRKGLWHQVAHILLVAPRPDGPVAILQRRARTKKTFAGLVDLSATGHLAAGEQPRGGVRELREELGVEVDPDDLFSLGVRRLVDDTPEGVNRELVHVFVIARADPLHSYRPDPGEVDAVIEVPIDALLRALDPELVEPPPAAAIAASNDGGLSSISLTAADLVPEPRLFDVSGTHPHGYWVSVLSAGQAYLDGKRPLAI